ncbi:MAG: hypothetical protein ACR2PV_09230 [Gammaproteobacteria bacterium]
MKKLFITTALSLALLSGAKAQTIQSKNTGFTLSIAPSLGVLINGNDYASNATPIMGGIDTSIGGKINNFTLAAGVQYLAGGGYDNDAWPSNLYDQSTSLLNIYGDIGYEIEATKRFSITPSVLGGVGFLKESYKASEDVVITNLITGAEFYFDKGTDFVDKLTGGIVGGGLDMDFYITNSFSIGLDNKFMVFLYSDTGNAVIYGSNGDEIDSAETSTGGLDPSFIYSANIKLAYTF